MFIPTPLSLVSWICTVRGWVVLQSAMMCAAYFIGAWVLRRVVWNFIKTCFENFITYNIFKDLLHEWIPKIKMAFYAFLVYTGVGGAGLLGALFNIQILLWIYAAYLLVTWAVNAYQMYQTIKSILDLQSQLEDACSKIGSFLGLGDCGEFFETVQQYTIGGAVAILFLQATTLICVAVLIRRKYKKTGFLFTDLFSSDAEREKRREKMQAKKDGSKKKRKNKAESADEASSEGSSDEEGKKEKRHGHRKVKMDSLARSRVESSKAGLDYMRWLEERRAVLPSAAAPSDEELGLADRRRSGDSAAESSSDGETFLLPRHERRGDSSALPSRAESASDSESDSQPYIPPLPDGRRRRGVARSN